MQDSTPSTYTTPVLALSLYLKQEVMNTMLLIILILPILRYTKDPATYPVSHVMYLVNDDVSCPLSKDSVTLNEVSLVLS